MCRFGKWRERKSRVEKDVRRIDSNHPFYAGDENPNAEMLRQILLTYSMYNFDLGYCQVIACARLPLHGPRHDSQSNSVCLTCNITMLSASHFSVASDDRQRTPSQVWTEGIDDLQGMSDLASPILYIMQDEAVAFWCFVNLMDRMEANFSDDSTSMQAQLDALQRLVQLADPELHAFIKAADSTNYFFCYRWLLVHFKREFTFDEVASLPVRTINLVVSVVTGKSILQYCHLHSSLFYWFWFCDNPEKLHRPQMHKSYCLCPHQLYCMVT